MKKHLILMTVAATLLTSCGGSKTTTAEADKFDYTVEQFADLQILRYKVPGFEELTLKQKELIYYLTEAALEGRDILFDQNGKYNLRIRRMLEAVYTNYQGDKTTPDFKNMEVYLKRVWFSNGIHHHYGTEKFVPDFSQEFLKRYRCQVAAVGERTDCRTTLCRTVSGDFRSDCYAETGKPGRWRRSCVDFCL